jgi:chorismate mutase
VPGAVRALRGATTVDDDTPEQIEDRVVALLREMLTRNGVGHDELVSILFTATDDVHSAFPAAAARTIGLGDVPLICARELDITDATPPVHPGDDAPLDRAPPRRAATRLPRGGQWPPR